MKYLLVVATTLLYFFGSAQDIIILKNGDDIKGKVIKVGVNEIEYKKENNGPLYVIQKSEVFIIKYENGAKDVFTNTETSNIKATQTEVSEKVNYHKEVKKTPIVFQYDSLNTNRFQEIIEIGGIFGAGNVSTTNKGYYIPFLNSSRYSYSNYYRNAAAYPNSVSLFSLRFIQGKRFKGDQFIGVGAEIDVSNNLNSIRNMYFPFFVEYRNTFTQKRVTPMFIQDIGGSFFVPSNNGTYALGRDVLAGGVLSNTSLGINIHITNSISCHFTLGYRLQHLTYEGTLVDYNGQESGIIRIHNVEHFVTLLTGFRF